MDGPVTSKMSLKVKTRAVSENEKSGSAEKGDLFTCLVVDRPVYCGDIGEKSIGTLRGNPDATPTVADSDQALFAAHVGYENISTPRHL